MHTILGAGGPVSNALTRLFITNKDELRLVSRRCPGIAPPHTWVKADLLNFKELFSAAHGSKVLYLCAGLQYNKEIWRHQWPLIIENVMKVTKETGARLIFFDNVYMYGLVQGVMTEDTPYNPCSRKGEVRAKIATRLMEEVKAGNMNASIARAADFYGATDSMNSFFDRMVLDKLSKKQKALWLGDPDTLHSFTLIEDAAKGVFTLGQHPESDNHIWHLPTAPALHGHDFIHLAASAIGANARYIKINKFILKAMGLFNPLIRETVEMYYQYQYDYHFSSERFEKTFHIRPTSYREGISRLANTFYKAERV